MKTYKYIVINKNNMKEVKHFTKVDDVVSVISKFASVGGKVSDDFIVLKNEKTIVDLSPIEDGWSFSKSIKILENA